MSTDNMTKKVVLSQIKEDLANGLTKWKRDDIGFGSLEKKYGLTTSEMVKLVEHPKVSKMETRIPTFVIEDDLSEEEVAPVVEVKVEPVRETRIVVEQPVVAQQKQLVNQVVNHEEEEEIIPFM